MQNSIDTLTGSVGAWTVVRPHCGKQDDRTSCGAFVIHHMKLLILGVELLGSNVPMHKSATQKDDTHLIRSQMARELLNCALDTGVALANERYPV